jgi:NAD(P)-dependent dehydrogenase (short-subunit alcohol dehydrogenase family)
MSSPSWRVAVTGAASGIGRAIAELLASRGTSVALLDVDAERLLGKQAQLRERHPDVDVAAIPLDVSDESAVIAAFTGLEASGGLDGLVNAAGIVIPGGTATTERVAWDRTLAVNLTGPWLCTKHAVPALRRRGGGSVVNIGSTASLVGFPDLAAYVASKGGLAQLTRAMALDLAPSGIRVNCVCPGHINTPLGDRFIDAQPDSDAFRRDFAAQHPVGRLGEPMDVAVVTAFLLLPESGFITGALFPVDGGYTAK